jgi:DNA-binding response OmpR family regulator
VEDEESSKLALKSILENAGYLVETAGTGQEALEKAQTKRFDVALIDIRLPDMDGTDLMLKLPRKSEMVKIVITGFSTKETGVKAADCGADDFLVKPVEPRELLCAIKERLAMKIDDRL